MTKQEFIMSYFELADKEPETSYYTLKKGYACMYNDEIPLTEMMVDNVGVHASGGDMDYELIQPTEWDLISMHISKEIEYVEE